MEHIEKPLVLVFDVGTQSTRTLIIDDEGEILAKESINHQPSYYKKNTDWAEQDADYYYQCICETCLRCKEKNLHLWKSIKGVSITTIRDTIICVDENGKPLRDAILWLDKRLADGVAEFSSVTKLGVKAIKLEEMANLQYRKSHLNWIKQREPEIWKKTYKLMLLSSYLIFKITGKMVDSIPSMVGHIPFSHKKRRWEIKKSVLQSVCPLEKSKMVDLVEAGSLIGKVDKSMSLDSGLTEGLNVYATGSDKACEILGLGCIREDQAAIGLGTTATMTFMSSKYLEPEKYIPAYASILPSKFNPEIEIFRGYWLISWFKKEFAEKEVVLAKERGISPEELLNERLKTIPPGCEGLMFQPYFTPNITMPTARGSIIGFSDVHTRIHLYRAIIEGINFALLDGMKSIERKTNHKFTSIYLGGGGSQSSEICQITADMFGIPVYRTQSYEATGIGSAIATFVAMGHFSTYEDAVDKMVKIKDVFHPRDEVHEIYQELYSEIFKDVYNQLSPLYKRLHRIYHKNKVKNC